MIKKSTAYWVAFVVLSLLTKASYALTVQKAQIIDVEGAPVLDLIFDEPFQPDIDPEDTETLLIELPENTKWSPPQESPMNNLGVSYKYIPYQDGSGDLIIKKEGVLKMGDMVQLGMNHYQIPFYARSGRRAVPIDPEKKPMRHIQTSKQSVNYQNMPLRVTKLQVGKKNQGTRFVMDLTRPTKFIIKESSDFTKVYITPAERAQWGLALKSNESFGLFQGYEITNYNGDTAVALSVQKGTRVSRAQILGEKEGQPKLVIDLYPQGIPLPLPMVNPEATAYKNTTPKISDVHHVVDHKPLLKSMDIIQQNAETILRLSLEDVQNFKVDENTETNEVTIYLPKLDWKQVNVSKEKGGLISDYRIDQEDSDTTKLILKVQKTTKVLGKKSFGRKGLARFVVYLSQGRNQTPPWLLDASSEGLSYDDLEKEEGQVSHILYRGGVRPYTTIGTGFYVGAKVSSVSGENKSHSENTPYSTDLANNNFGGAAHIFAGYGLNYGSLYGGIELEAGIYGVDDKISFAENGVTHNSSSDIKYIWGGSGRFGYYITPTTLLYSRLGFISGSFRYGATGNPTGEVIYPNDYARSRRSGFIYGLGLEAAINDTFSARIEGSQINFQTFKFLQGATSSKKDRFLLNQMSIGGAYKFSPMAGPSMGGIYDESVGTGFYFGLSGGLATLANHRKVRGHNGVNARTTYDGQGSTLDPSWSVFAGWSEQLNRFLFAGEFQLDLTKPIISESLSHGAGNTTEEYSNKIRWLWALTGRAGYIFNHGTIGYGRLGIVGAQIAHRGHHAGAQRIFTMNGGSNSYGLGIRMGAGLEAFINKHLAIRGDYVLDYIPGIKIKDRSDSAYREEVTLINNEFKLGLSWYLDP